jgi:single-stranded DNA-binding protein
MQATISGYTGRDAEIKPIPRKDGSGNVSIGETTLAVKVGVEETDWYKLKFIGDTLSKAAKYIFKGDAICVVGNLTFETWNDEQGKACSRPVINVSEVQLPPKPKTV